VTKKPSHHSSSFTPQSKTTKGFYFLKGTQA
jgi:hypothetical protein